MPTPPLPIVLILRTGNSCRSHLAEGVLRQAAADRLDVRSAGSQPAGYVHPLDAVTRQSHWPRNAPTRRSSWERKLCEE